MRSFIALLLAALILAGCKESTINPNEGVADEPDELYYTILEEDEDIPVGVFAINDDGTNRHMVLAQGVIFSSPFKDKMLGITPSSGIVLCRTSGEILNVIAALPQVNSACPIFSPVGDKVACTKVISTTTGSITEIHVIDADGTNDIVIEPKAASEALASWSPDGTRLAYFKKGEVVDGANRDSLFVVNSDGSDRYLLTVQGTSFNDYRTSLDWSPDGTRLACVTEISDQLYDILVVDANGGGSWKLTSDGLRKLTPVWSPDGGKIAYVAIETPSTAGVIFTVNADGTNKRRYIVSEDNIVSHPQWSPHGTYISVTENIDDAIGTLMLLNVESGAVTRLDDQVYKAFWKR